MVGVVGADRPVDEECERIAAALRALPHGGGSGDALLEAAASLVERLGPAYPLLVPLRHPLQEDPAHWGDTVRLTVERVVVPVVRRFAERPRGWWDRAAAVFRRIVEAQEHGLGISPQSIDYALSAASRARSYHLTVRGPEGSFLAGQELRRVGAQGTRPVLGR